MSQNNTIRKSDKKFIRLEKARIRRQFLDVKKQEELIDNLYKKFLTDPKKLEVKTKEGLSLPAEEPKKTEVKKESKATKRTVKKSK